MPTLKYCRTATGNFGDDLNLILWKSLFPDFDSYHKEIRLYGIGTLLGGRSKVHPAGTKAVLGSGFGYKSPIKTTADWKFYWVRGPLTAKKLGLPPKLALTDPAILWGGLKPGRTSEKLKIGIAPHFKTLAAYDWSEICKRSNLILIDPRKSPQAVADQITACSSILAESLHAAIFADALRVPWRPIILSHRFNRFKWMDWTMSVHAPFNPSMLGHFPHTTPAQTADQLRALALKGLGAVGIISRHHGLRPVGGSTVLQIDRIVEQLSAIGSNSNQLHLSDEKTLNRLRAEMLICCGKFASDFDLKFTPENSFAN